MVYYFRQTSRRLRRRWMGILTAPRQRLHHPVLDPGASELLQTLRSPVLRTPLQPAAVALRTGTAMTRARAPLPSGLGRALLRSEFRRSEHRASPLQRLLQAPMGMAQPRVDLWYLARGAQGTARMLRSCSCDWQLRHGRSGHHRSCPYECATVTATTCLRCASCMKLHVARHTAIYPGVLLHLCVAFIEIQLCVSINICHTGHVHLRPLLRRCRHFTIWRRRRILFESPGELRMLTVVDLGYIRLPRCQMF